MSDLITITIPRAEAERMLDQLPLRLYPYAIRQLAEHFALSEALDPRRGEESIAATE